MKLLQKTKKMADLFPHLGFKIFSGVCMLVGIRLAQIRNELLWEQKELMRLMLTNQAHMNESVTKNIHTTPLGKTGELH
jgi:hypothetical protein